MVAYYVFGTQVFPAREVFPQRGQDSFLMDRRVGDGTKWFGLCPHAPEVRTDQGARQNVLLCQECGEEHFDWNLVESRTLFLPASGVRSERYNPVGSLVIFHEDQQPLPGKFLIGLPPSQQGGTIILWRVLVPEANGAVISTLGSALYRNTGGYTDAGKKFHVVEMLSLIDHNHGMAVSTTDWRIALTWGGAQINFKTTQRVAQTVDS